MTIRLVAIGSAIILLFLLVGLVVWGVFWWFSGPKYEYAWVTPDSEIYARPWRAAAFQEDPSFVTCNGSADDSPALSWDGNKLAFASDRDGDWDIYLLGDGDCRKFRGGGLTPVSPLIDTRALQLTDDPGSDMHPSWSPDGEWLAFDSDRTGVSQIFIMRSDGTQLRQLTHGPRRSLAPKWSPDGEKIVFQAARADDFDLYTITPEGRGEKVLISSEGDDVLPVWSKDGRSIAFASYRDGNANIYVLDLGTRAVRALTADPAEDTEPAWKGDDVFFSTNRNGGWQVYRIRRSGETPEREWIASGRSFTAPP